MKKFFFICYKIIFIFCVVVIILSFAYCLGIVIGTVLEGLSKLI